MSDLQWAPDGTRMFKKLLDAVPEAMREMVKPQLLKFLAAKAAGKPVNSEVVTKMVQEDLPEPQRGVIMQALGIKEPAGKKVEKKEAAPPPEPEPIGGLKLEIKDQWAGNSKDMFERMIQEVPETLRDVFRVKLMDIMNKKSQGGVYQEKYVVEIVNEIVPEPFKSNILKAFATIGGIDVSAVEKIIEDFPGGEESLISLMHAIQAQFGYVPEEALKMVSQKKDVFMSTLYRLVTSYQAFRTDPSKKHTVAVCNGTGCHLKGSGAMLKRLEEKVSDDDSQITLEKVRCLGCCDLSPTVVVNGEAYGGTDAQAKISEIIEE
jgi:NADH-quinone oxidoreductase subunit E